MTRTPAESRTKKPPGRQQKASGLPLRVDAQKVFRQGLQLEGSLPLADMQHLSTSLTDTRGQVSVKLNFTLDEQRHRCIHGAISARLNVQCQRCMEPMALTVEDTLALAVVSSEAQAKGLIAELDPWLCEDDVIAIGDIVEEQLILAMPIVSLHSECSPQSVQRQKLEEMQKEAADTRADGKASNPFAVLANLKSDQQNTQG